MPKILFRADALKSIGIGDLKSLSYLAQTFDLQGWDCQFLCKESLEARKVMSSQGQWPCLFFDAQTPLDQEIRLIKQIVREDRIDCLFLEITERPLSEYPYFEGPMNACVNFDGCVPLGMDLIVNWCVVSDSRLYLEHRNAKTILGYDQALLADNLPTSSISKTKPENLLILMGGCDEFSFASRLIDDLAEQLSDFKVKLVCGPGAESPQGLPAFVELVYQPESLNSLYAWADLSLSAGGLSSLELVSCAVPAMLFALYAHQQERCQFLESKGLAIYAGSLAEYQSEKARCDFYQFVSKWQSFRSHLQNGSLRGVNEQVFQIVDTHRQSRQLAA